MPRGVYLLLVLLVGGMSVGCLGSETDQDPAGDNASTSPPPTVAGVDALLDHRADQANRSPSSGAGQGSNGAMQSSGDGPPSGPPEATADERSDGADGTSSSSGDGATSSDADGGAGSDGDGTGSSDGGDGSTSDEDGDLLRDAGAPLTAPGDDEDGGASLNETVENATTGDGSGSLGNLTG